MSNTPMHFLSIEEEIDYILDNDVSMTDVAMECNMYYTDDDTYENVYGQDFITQAYIATDCDQPIEDYYFFTSEGILTDIYIDSEKWFSNVCLQNNR